MKENRDIACGKKNVMSVAAAWTAQGSIKTSIRTVLQRSNTDTFQPGRPCIHLSPRLRLSRAVVLRLSGAGAEAGILRHNRLAEGSLAGGSPGKTAEVPADRDNSRPVLAVDLEEGNTGSGVFHHHRSSRWQPLT